MDEKAQVPLEYILLVGGAVLLLLLVTITIRERIFAPVTNSTAGNASAIRNLTQSLS